MKSVLKRSIYVRLAILVITIQVIMNAYFALEPGLKEIKKQQSMYAPVYINQLKTNSVNILNKVSESIKNDTNFTNIHIQSIIEEQKLNYNIVDVDPIIRTLERSYISPKLYVWFSDINHNFVSGFPALDFDKLNTSYESDKTYVKSANVLKNKDEYFSILLGYTENEKLNSDWVYNDEFNRVDIQREYGRFYFSKKIKNESGNDVGTLYLKIDDSDNRWIIYADRAYEQRKNYKNYTALTNILSFLVFWLLLPSWVYTDAREKGINNPMAWAILPLISFVFGWLVYFFLRKKLSFRTRSPSCTTCNHLVPDGSDFCPHCGNSMSLKNNCPECEKEVLADWSFCPSCRASLKEN